MTRNARPSGGFTLLELMVTVTVMAVLLAIAVPTFRNTIQRNRVSSASNDMLAALSYARTTAITRSQLVSMCPSPDGTTCTSAGLAFEPGWIVYTYPAGPASANQAYVDGTDTRLRVQGLHTGVSIHALQAEVITFGQQGQLRSSNTELKFLICARPGDSGIGTSTATVPGVLMEVLGSGSVKTTALTAGASCSTS